MMQAWLADSRQLHNCTTTTIYPWRIDPVEAFIDLGSLVWYYYNKALNPGAALQEAKDSRDCDWFTLRPPSLVNNTLTSIKMQNLIRTYQTQVTSNGRPCAIVA